MSSGTVTMRLSVMEFGRFTGCPWVEWGVLLLLEHCLGLGRESFADEVEACGGGNLPDAEEVILVENLFVTDDGDVFGLCLGDEHAVEGIFVFAG